MKPRYLQEKVGTWISGKIGPYALYPPCARSDSPTNSLPLGSPLNTSSLEQRPRGGWEPMPGSQGAQAALSPWSRLLRPSNRTGSAPARWTTQTHSCSCRLPSPPRSFGSLRAGCLCVRLCETDGSREEKSFLKYRQRWDHRRKCGNSGAAADRTYVLFLDPASSTPLDSRVILSVCGSCITCAPSHPPFLVSCTGLGWKEQLIQAPVKFPCSLSCSPSPEGLRKGLDALLSHCLLPQPSIS